MQYSVMLFDLDQTLIIKKPDTTELIFSILRESCLTVQVEQVQRAFAQSEIWIAQQVMKENETGVLMGDDEFLDHIWAAYRDEMRLPHELKAKILPIFRGECEQQYELMPGAKETLRELRENGVLLGVVSNHRTSVRKVLDQFGLTEFFAAIVISDEVKLWKPDPAIIRLALEKMGVKGESALYTGDHPFDILCAHEAGIHAAWMPPNPYYFLPDLVGKPEYEISSLAQLIEI